MIQKNYGDGHASLYDKMYGAEAHPEIIDALEELAAGGSVLELGVGTGRVAVPLAMRGLSVVGIDNSSEMLAHLARKPGGAQVVSLLCELPSIEVEGQFQLIICIDQTFLLLTSQEQQIICLENAAARLAPEGKIVLETFAAAVPPGGGVLLTQANSEATVLWAVHADPISQRFHNREIVFCDGKAEVIPFDGRGVTTAELDLMARLAGLKLESRWADWRGSKSYSGAMSLISIYSTKNPEV